MTEHVQRTEGRVCLTTAFDVCNPADVRVEWLPVAPGHAPAHGGRTRAVMPTPLGRMGKDRHRFRRRMGITHPSTAYA